MASKGFIELLRLADRGRRRSEGQLGSEQTLWSGVAFRIADVNLVTPLGEVAEVVNETSVTALPKVQPWMKGIANLRGRLLPVTDLLAFVGVEDAKSSRIGQRKTIVIDQPDLYSGLLVDQVYGIQHFQSQRFVGQSLQVHEGIDPYLQGYFTTADKQVWHIFMMSRLAKDERYRDASQ